jgi:hypothetical protein
LFGVALFWNLSNTIWKKGTFLKQTHQAGDSET